MVINIGQITLRIISNTLTDTAKPLRSDTKEPTPKEIVLNFTKLDNKTPSKEEIEKEVKRLEQSDQFKLSPPGEKEVKRIIEEKIEFIENALIKIKKELNDPNSKDKESNALMLKGAQEAISLLKKVKGQIAGKTLLEIKKIIDEQDKILETNLKDAKDKLFEDISNKDKYAIALLVDHLFKEVSGLYAEQFKDYLKARKALEVIATYNLTGKDNFDNLNAFFPYRKKYSSESNGKNLKNYDSVANMISTRLQISSSSSVRYEAKSKKIEIKGEKKLDPLLSKLVSTQLAELFHKSPEILTHIMGNSNGRTLLKLVIVDAFNDETLHSGTLGFYSKEHHTLFISRQTLLAGLLQDHPGGTLWHELIHALDVDPAKKEDKEAFDGILPGMQEEDKKRYIEIVDKSFKIQSGEIKSKEGEENIQLVLLNVLGPYAFTNKSEFTPEAVAGMMKNPEAFQTNKDLKVIYEILSKYFNIDPLNDLKETNVKKTLAEAA